ncbi:tyrosine-protein kinase ITK/TSK [Pelomyxa schiedti]|nr:tyrosine-protein kinase ITK/TSK [Pelomyxa schiedti]
MSIAETRPAERGETNSNNDQQTNSAEEVLRDCPSVVAATATNPAAITPKRDIRLICNSQNTQSDRAIKERRVARPTGDHGSFVNHGAHKTSSLSTYPSVGTHPLQNMAFLENSPPQPSIDAINEARRIVCDSLSHFPPDARRGVLAPILKQLEILSWDVQSSQTQETHMPQFPPRGQFHNNQAERETEPAEEVLLSGVELVSEIKSGSFGTVWNAHWNGTKVAVKQVKNTPGKHQVVSESTALINREAAILSRVSHPNIVQFFGTCAIDGNRMLVMELCHGNLLQLLQTSSSHTGTACGCPSISETDLLLMCRDVSAGMEYLAQSNIIHRDLACRNCLYIKLANGEYCVKVSDMGQARFCTNEYWSTSNCLPKKWAALEVLLGDPATKASDVWSFGVVMWEILSRGGDPYEDLMEECVTILDFLQQGERLYPPSHVAQEVANVMQLCWQTDPKDRPTFSKLHETLIHLCSTTTWPNQQQQQTSGSTPPIVGDHQGTTVMPTGDPINAASLASG